jgi:hypothetical protein
VAQQLAFPNRIITTWQTTWTLPLQSPEIGMVCAFRGNLQKP